MTHRASCRLPKRPSALIRLAIADLKKAERTEGYRVDMNTWHDGATLGETLYDPATCITTETEAASPCVVCFAGSVMAFSLNAPQTRNTRPEDYPEDVAIALSALDKFGMGWVFIALVRMGISNRRIDKAVKAVGGGGYLEVVDYEDDPAAFKRKMLWIATKARQDRPLETMGGSALEGGEKRNSRPSLTSRRGGVTGT
jgi:hypothetical protein